MFKAFRNLTTSEQNSSKKSDMTDEQKQQYFLDLLDNGQLAEYIQAIGKPLKSSALIKVSGSFTGVEKRIAALNTASHFVYTDKEYAGLLANIGVKLTAEQLTEVQRINADLYARHNELTTRLKTVELFCVLYRALRMADANGQAVTTDFVASIEHLPSFEQYAAIQKHVQDSIFAGNQSRSLTAWTLTQDTLRTPHTLTEDDAFTETSLVRTIYELANPGLKDVAGKALGRASIEGIKGNKTFAILRVEIQSFLMEHGRLFNGSPGEDDAFYREKLHSSGSDSGKSYPSSEGLAENVVEPVVVSPLMLKARQLTDHQPWISKTTMINIGEALLNFIDITITQGSMKSLKLSEADRAEFQAWHDAVSLEIHSYLRLDNLPGATAVGLYLFQKNHNSDYVPDAALVETLASATGKDPSHVLAYLNGFMVKGASVRSVHNAVVADQLGLTARLPAVIKDSKFNAPDPYIDHLLNILIELTVFTQTPFAVAKASEQLAKEALKSPTLSASEKAKGSKVSALDLQLGSTIQPFRAVLTQLGILKTDTTCTLALEAAQLKIEKSLNELSVELSNADKVATIDQLRTENKDLRHELAIARAEIAALKNPAASMNATSSFDHPDNKKALKDMPEVTAAVQNDY